MFDLLTNEPFTKDDIITIQDPTDLEAKSLANFHYLKEGLTVDDDDKANRAGVNASASTTRIMQQVRALSLCVKRLLCDREGGGGCVMKMTMLMNYCIVLVGFSLVSNK